ncbi:MAG: SIS domain-containing protein [Thaumarchaeota archaeon]|nr:SIS domain-containing protein [Nitrososphaerota archaeon]
MSTPPPVAERTAHPFLTYDMIKDIPKGFKATLRALADFKPQSTDEMVFTGNGTAFYAALMGSQVLDLSDRSWRAVQAFELVHYDHELARKTLIVGVSHSGITKSTLDALSKEKSRGAKTIGLTHFPDRPISKVCDTTLVIGDGPDRSRCHTKAYTDSAAGVLCLSLALAAPLHTGLEDVKKEFETQLSGRLEATISSTDEIAKKAAHELRNISRIFFAGAGPNFVTAREAALKIKEASYLPAEGMCLEEILHGPGMSFDPQTLVVVFAPSGPSVERARDLLAAANQIGATTMVISDLSQFNSDYAFQIPKTHEYLSPFLCILPAYLFAYYLAVEQGKNPDYIHYLDPKYWGARNIIFPPGTH